MMRLATILTTALVLFALPALAQLTPAWGVKGGLNISEIDMEDVESSSQSGWVAGLFVDLGSPLLHLQAEALYSVRQSELGPANPNAYDVEVESTYLQVPVLVKLGLPLPAVAPSVYAGPAVAFPIDAKMTDAAGEWVDLDDFSKETVWSVVVGVDVKLLDLLIVDLRYDIGLTELNERPVGDVLDDINDEFTETESYRDIKDRTFTVMVGLEF
jgi:hypothetical protein